MKKRQLFKGIDKHNQIVKIEDIDKQEKATYLCPYCKKEVVPKMGDKNVWHFAHKDKVCEYLNIKSKDNAANSTLDLTNIETKSLDDIEIRSESKRFLCVKCKKKYLKEEGLVWEGNEYICRECFNRM